MKVLGKVKANKSGGLYFNLATEAGASVQANIPADVANALFGSPSGPAILEHLQKEWPKARQAAFSAGAEESAAS